MEENYKLLIIWLNTFPIAGPSSVRIAITTTATKTRINAYSTRPCPFSFGAYNILFHHLSFFCPIMASGGPEKL
jgi:hypothetical protein